TGGQSAGRSREPDTWRPERGQSRHAEFGAPADRVRGGDSTGSGRGLPSNRADSRGGARTATEDRGRGQTQRGGSNRPGQGRDTRPDGVGSRPARIGSSTDGRQDLSSIAQTKCGR